MPTKTNLSQVDQEFYCGVPRSSEELLINSAEELSGFEFLSGDLKSCCKKSSSSSNPSTFGFAAATSSVLCNKLIFYLFRTIFIHVTWI